LVNDRSVAEGTATELQDGLPQPTWPADLFGRSIGQLEDDPGVFEQRGTLRGQPYGSSVAIEEADPE